jgi:geranylgeranyl diphosphate synthase type I
MSPSSALQTIQARYLPLIQTELRDLFSAESFYSDLYNKFHYHMGWLDSQLRPTSTLAGKRVRPVLCLLACEACGGALEKALPAAAGVETLHNFSLLHDDIEDNSDSRRGQPSVWKRWGVPQAINAGDGMFALAHLAFDHLPGRGVPLERALTARRAFDQTCLTLTHGQYLDMSFEERLDVSVDAYMTMISGKTAALIAASAYLGAFLGGADDASAAHYRAFGHHLGLSFQVRDDILGIWGDAVLTGKSTSSDIETRKKTLPVVYGLEQSAKLRQLYAQAITTEQVKQVIQILDELGARKLAEETAAEQHQKAMQALELAGASGQAGQALEELAASLLKRAN